MSEPRPRISAVLRAVRLHAPLTPVHLTGRAQPGDHLGPGGARSRTSTSTSTSHEILLAVDDLEVGDRAVLLGEALVSSASAAGTLSAMTLTRAVCAERACRRRLPRIPVHVDEALRRGGETGQGLAVPAMDGDALAGGDDADDLVARHRMAAAREMIGHAGHQSGDRHAGCPPGARRGARQQRSGPCAARARSGAAPDRLR